MGRAELIIRKQEVRRQLQRAQAALAALENAADPQRDRRRMGQLQQQIEQWMAEEYNLRLAIDRSPQEN